MNFLISKEENKLFNKVILIGRLTRDPDTREFDSGRNVTNFGLAVDRDFKNASGKKETDFIEVATWGKLADLVAKYTQKGQLVAVEGRLQISNSEDKDGNKRKFTNVIANNVKFLEYKNDNKEEKEEEKKEGDLVDSGEDASDDDLPF